MIEFNINHQTITRNDDFDVVADSKNYLLAKFTCSDEWKEKVTAIFGWGGKYFNVLIEDGICMVPWEVIKAPFFTVSAICGDRITANEITVAVEESGCIEGETPKPPTPDVYAQILSSVKPPYIGENGNWFLWDSDTKAFVDSGVNAKVNADSEVGTAIVKAFTEALEEAEKKDADILKDAKAYTDERADLCADVINLTTDIAKNHIIKDSSQKKITSLNIYGECENPVISVSGKNLFDINNVLTNWLATSEVNGSSITITATSDASSNYAQVGHFYLVAGQTYRYSLNVSGETNAKQVYWFASGSNMGYSEVFTPTKSGYYSLLLYAIATKGSGIGTTITYSNVQVELGTTATDYEEYKEQQIETISCALGEGESLAVENVSLHTNYPNTVITCDADCEVTYKADTTNVYKNLLEMMGQNQALPVAEEASF